MICKCAVYLHSKKKFEKNYPNENIIFEDSNTAILIQAGKEVHRIKMKEAEKLDMIIHAFLNYERPEIKNFRNAIDFFKQDIPKVTETLREIIEEQEKSNKIFVEKCDLFLKLITSLKAYFEVVAFLGTI